MSKLDTKMPGYLSREDYELMGRKLAEYGGMTKEQAESCYKEFMKVADALSLKPGVKIPLEVASQQASKMNLSNACDDCVHSMVFDVIDSNKDGYICLEEFKVYFQVIAPAISETEVAYSFKTIDADKDGEISREEFLAASEDFFNGVEETELSKVFMGHLID